LHYPNQKFHDEPNWRSYTRTPVATMPQALQNWLLDRGSLTQRLTDISGGEFRVEILNQQMAFPKLSDIKILGIPYRQKALIREVILYGRNEPWVYARSVIPIKTLTGRLRRLRKLDNSPLGALLFRDITMQRGEMQIACIPARSRHLPSQLPIDKNDILWGRRSAFYLDNKPLLVSEMFLPGFKPYNGSLSTHFYR
jgi:chorismate--pyruvate lyase